jgi:hypothetical protein
MAGRSWASRTNSSSSHSPAAGVAGCWWCGIPLLLATKSAGEACFEYLVVSLQYFLAWCRGKNEPSVDHGSHGKTKTYVLHGGRSKLLHRTIAGSSRSCHGATAHLNHVARSFRSAEERATPDHHAQAGTCEKIPADPSLHSWWKSVLLEWGHHRGT